MEAILNRDLQFDRPIWLILGLACLLRLSWALLVPVDPVSDSAIYDIFAREIAGGRGYSFPDGSPTVYWAVGAPALYGAGYWLVGPIPASVVSINLALGIAFVAGMYWLALNYFDPGIAILAATFVALWPVWIQFTTVLNSELPFVMLVTLSLAVFSERRLGWGARSVFGAIFLTGAIYMRPIALPLLIIIPLAGWLEHRSIKRALGHTVTCCLIAALMIAPWALRNRDAFGTPTLISANFGANLWMGNNPKSNGGYMPLPAGNYGNEVQRDSYFKAQALEFISQSPGRYALLSLKRVQLSFDRESIGVAWNQAGIPRTLQKPIKAVSALYWYFLALLALVGFIKWVSAKPTRIFSPLVLTAGLFSAIAILVVGMDRYHLPLSPIIALLAAVGAKAIHTRRWPEGDTGHHGT